MYLCPIQMKENLIGINNLKMYQVLIENITNLRINSADRHYFNSTSIKKLLFKIFKIISKILPTQELKDADKIMLNFNVFTLKFNTYI